MKKMVMITASHTVLPSAPTPSGSIELSAFDKQQKLHMSSIHIYKQPSQNDTMEIVIQKMKESLGHLLVYYYPFAGRLRVVQGDERQVDCNGKGALLREANTELKLTDYGDLAPSKAVEDLVPVVDYTTPIETWPVFLVQLTRFSCGGFCVGVTFCHNLVDGWSSFLFLNSWAKLFRGQALDKDEIPIFDRKILKPKFPVRSLYHDEFSPLPIVLGRSDAVAEKQHETMSMSLHLTRKQVNMLKKKANEAFEQSETTGNHTVRPYSTFVVLAGHIWRSACKARQPGLDPNQPTVVRMVASIRSRLNPPVPRNYAGNAITMTRTPICIFDDIISNPLGYSAQKIRETLDRVTEERIRSAMDVFDSNASDCSLLRRTRSSKANFFGNPNISIGSLMNMGLYDTDFGWGKPFYAGPTCLEDDGKIYIMPAYPEDGSVNIIICLQTRHAESFRKYLFEEVI